MANGISNPHSLALPGAVPLSGKAVDECIMLTSCTPHVHLEKLDDLCAAYQHFETADGLTSGRSCHMLDKVWCRDVSTLGYLSFI